MILPRADTSTSPAVDLTPVIDMVFLLLIFFLVATTFQQTEREMKIALPTASAAGPISAAMREIIINIDADGRVFVGGRAMTDDELSGAVRDAVGRNAEQKVSIRGDRAAPYAHIARVLGLCKGAGIAEPYLETTPTSGTPQPRP